MERVAEFLGAPTTELSASALSARISVGAANQGHAFVHQEHRLSAVMPPEARPEIDVGDVGPDAAPETWQDGVLLVPKYFSAFLEAPLPTFHPGHRSKWRPHELLHRLAKFAWRPDLTRFEAYLTARISELLPVVHWYGFDEIGRFACPRHRGRRPDRGVCEACERGLVPYWHANNTLAAAETAAAHALEHLHTELDACARELEHGAVVETPRPGLDASSDAIGYLRGHWNRLTAWSFGAWVERFARPGQERFTTCSDHLQHVRDLARRLLHAPWDLDPLPVRQRRRTKRWISDLAYRVLLHVEALDSDQAEDELLPPLDALAEQLDDPEADPQAVVADLESRLRSLDPAAAERTLGGGWLWRPPSPGSLTMLQEGLRSALPRALADQEPTTLQACTHGLALADQHAQPRDLASRAADVLATTIPRPPAEAARFEAWLRRGPRIDLEAERFAALPDETPSGGRVRVNATYREGVFPASAVAAVLGAEPEPAAEVVLGAVHWNGEARVVDVDDPVRQALRAAREGVVSPGAATTTLLERGFIVWMPDVR